MWYTRKNKPIIKFALFRLLLLCFLYSLFSGCGSSSSPEDRQDQASASSMPEREPWEGICAAKSPILDNMWNHTLFPEQRWETVKNNLRFQTKDTFVMYYPDLLDDIEIDDAAWQVFSTTCEWTILDADTAQRMDAEWLQFMPSDYRLQHADFYDLNFRCTDYIGCQVLIADLVDPPNPLYVNPTNKEPPLAWRYQIFTEDGKIFNVSSDGAIEESLIPFPTLFGISIFGF